MNTQVRKSYTDLNKIYFWTATIHNWLPLLAKDENKKVIINSLKKLSNDKLISVYAFVIMPNHIHLMWSQDGMNGKETPKGSLLKYTAHIFLKYVKASNESHLYEVNALNKKHEIWQRDSLGIEIFNENIAKQKLDYIHFNPLSGKWQLATTDIDYYYSSAKFYETQIDEFGFLQNIFQMNRVLDECLQSLHYPLI